MTLPGRTPRAPYTRAPRRPGAAMLGAACVAAVALTGSATSSAAAPAELVLSPEGNHLWAYDATSGEAQLVVEAVNGEQPNAAAPSGSDRRDINGQVCVSPDGRHAVTGEDTVIAADDGGDDGGGSHDPRIAGWGYFAIEGAAIGEIRVDEVGKLAPEAGSGPGYAGDPDNYGCGFLDGDRLLTTAIGDTLPGQPANGQLFLWFAPFDAGYRQVTEDGITFFVGAVDHCQIDDTLATAGGIAVADAGSVYVAANRPDDRGNGGAVWRYSGDFPASLEECTPEYVEANITKDLVIPPAPLVPGDPLAPTPSAVAIGPAGTLYVSSVFSGNVSEFTTDGTWVRDIWPASPVAPRSGPRGDTPFGLAVTADGSLWIADIGIVGGGPAAGEGAVVRVPFTNGDPEPPGETIADGLTFPDGLGVYRPTGDGAPPAQGRDGDAPADGNGSAGNAETGTVGTAGSTGLPATGAGAPVAALAILVGAATFGITRRPSRRHIARPRDPGGRQ